MRKVETENEKQSAFQSNEEQWRNSFMDKKEIFEGFLA